jgi:hypothetical protein
MVVSMCDFMACYGKLMTSHADPEATFRASRQPRRSYYVLNFIPRVAIPYAS